MGIPSSLLTWTNEIIAIKRKLRINAAEFDQAINEVTLHIYRKGFDVRFQTSQTIPVVINELLTRLFYSIRRTIKYFQLNDSSQWNFNELWEACNPYSNASVGRMLTVSHATFELIDISDAIIRSYGTNNPIEFIVRLNLIGV
ncbi:hypothetical protein [Ruoffia tabacinasalis]|uniref:hypothetical protein n=1 Tax=Ruoffia tabacinasalis TaxID=87458 RepID=UPI0018CC969C|nr:hypothetical protein [Ruoffia tabacinasalis]